MTTITEMYCLSDISSYKIIKSHTLCIRLHVIISVIIPAKHGPTLGKHTVQHKGTFHCLVYSRLRCCNLRLFNHSEWLSFSFISLGVGLNARDAFLLHFATTTTKERIVSNIDIKGSFHQNHKTYFFTWSL